MKEPAPTLTSLRVFIILFCLWHMASVAVYALPWEASDPLTNAVRAVILPIVRPYILLTSQWQQWNLFSPDPLQRVVTYTVEIDRGNRWEPVHTIAPGFVSTFRHASEFKFLGRTLEGNKTLLPVVDRFLQAECRDADLPASSRVRLLYHWYVLPHPVRALSVGEWSSYQPQINTFIGSEVLCGWPEGTGIYRALNP